MRTDSLGIAAVSLLVIPGESQVFRGMAAPRPSPPRSPARPSDPSARHPRGPGRGRGGPRRGRRRTRATPTRWPARGEGWWELRSHGGLRGFPPRKPRRRPSGRRPSRRFFNLLLLFLIEGFRGDPPTGSTSWRSVRAHCMDVKTWDQHELILMVRTAGKFGVGRGVRARTSGRWPYVECRSGRGESALSRARGAVVTLRSGPGGDAGSGSGGFAGRRDRVSGLGLECGQAEGLDQVAPASQSGVLGLDPWRGWRRAGSR